MAQLSSVYVNKEFGEINVWWNPDNTLRVRATILMKPDVEGAQTGLALDGSASMKALYGVQEAIGAFSPGSIFCSVAPQLANNVRPVAASIAAYLANFDSDGESTAVYFACGRMGAEVEPIGELTESTARTFPFSGPRSWGTGTRIVPAMKYFLKHFDSAPWVVCLFITDGKLDDVEEAKALSKQICLDMSAGRRKYVKFVVIGLGKEFADENSEAAQTLAELDDLDEDPDYAVEGQDLWDHKIANDLRCLDEIFAETVSENMIVAPSAQVLDSNGCSVRPNNVGSYSTGLPALLDFNMPASSRSFEIVLPNGCSLVQDISPALQFLRYHDDCEGIDYDAFHQ